MFEKLEFKINELRVLIVIPLVLGPLFTYFSEQAISIRNAVPLGSAEIRTKKVNNQLWATNVVEHHKISVEFIIIGSASEKELNLCPGISKKIARKIIKERKFKKFYDWRDFQDRIGMGKTKIQQLKEAGVKLNP